MVTDTLFVLDLFTIISLLVLANLSQRIGEALRIYPVYTVFYFSVAIVVVASFIDLIFGSGDTTTNQLFGITLLLRGIGVIISIPVAFKYWHWLFKEKL